MRIAVSASTIFTIVAFSYSLALAQNLKLKCTHKCPKEMVAVCNQNINICVDRYEVHESDTRLSIGFMNQVQCRSHCTQQGKRLLTNIEWKTACKGTQPEKCNIHRPHPIIRLANGNRPWVRQRVDCKKGDNRWSKICMNDPRINELERSIAESDEFPSCISHYGVHDMVGNLGEWVNDSQGRFNGGLYPQPSSSCNYTTTAHNVSYSDYSIGCRCASEPLFN